MDRDGAFIEMVFGASIGHMIDKGATDEEILAVVQVGIDKIRCAMKNHVQAVTDATETILKATR